MKWIQVVFIGRDLGNARPLTKDDNRKEIIRGLAIECLRSMILGCENFIKQIVDDSTYFEKMTKNSIRLFRISEWDEEEDE